LRPAALLLHTLDGGQITALEEISAKIKGQAAGPLTWKTPRRLSAGRVDKLAQWL